jgi:ribosome-interacting GTPase 1
VIVQKASGMSDVSIKADKITRIEQEVSNVGTLVRFNRPSRRIVIYAEKPHGECMYIDVSLKHFVADDVRKLMRAIQVRRPDLEFPKHWT